MSSRGPKRKIVTNEVETQMKMVKMEMLVQPKVEVVDKEEKLTHHSCPICNLKLECAPGDMVMKRHYMEKHYTGGGLLEMVALDLGEGQRLRCPYPDCEVRTLFRRSIECNRRLSFIFLLNLGDQACFNVFLSGGEQAHEAPLAEHPPGEEPQHAEEAG